MTEYQFPTDPAAYVVINEASIPYGGLVAMTVRTKPKHHGGFSVLLWRYEGDALHMLLDDARGYARYAPGNIPSDEHIIMAALVAEGLLGDDMTDPAGLGLLGEDDDGEPEPDASGIEGGVPDDVMSHSGVQPAGAAADYLGATLLHVVVNDSDRAIETVADLMYEFHGDDETSRAIEALARGETLEVRVGGGAAPLVVITRAVVDVCREHSADPMLDAAPAMLAALKAIVSGLTQAVQTCDLSGADQHRLEGAVGILRCDARFAADRARQAIAKAEGAV